jgi:hypothetical protein
MTNLRTRLERLEQQVPPPEQSYDIIRVILTDKPKPGRRLVSQHGAVRQFEEERYWDGVAGSCCVSGQD